MRYLNLELLRVFGRERYQHLCALPERRDYMLGEWLFGHAAFGDLLTDLEKMEYRVLCEDLDEILESLHVTHHEFASWREELLPEVVEKWALEEGWAHYDVVGFTSTFEQNVASLAMARHLKQQHPRLTIVFGGANVDGPMGPEYLRAFPYIDYVVVGEGDLAFPALLRSLANGESTDEVPGVASHTHAAPPAPVTAQHLNESPDPDYDDYFRTLRILEREGVWGRGIPPSLPIETARGCWWGAKHHCTFCGLNGQSMTFRAKTPDRALEEIGRLSTKYNSMFFHAVDNIIDPSYLTQLCPKLCDTHWDIQLFYEVKANLTKEQIRVLAEAGVERIQPGIESLSQNVLDRMRKGTTPLINIRTLRWAMYYGLRINWNILMGLPGETQADYDAQIELIPSLYHLPPPTGALDTWLERFSPYFFDESFPIENKRPRPAYQYLYPRQQVDLHNIAYFFDADVGDVLPDEARDGLRRAVRVWQQFWRQGTRPVLFYSIGPSLLVFGDSRQGEKQTITSSGAAGLVYLPFRRSAGGYLPNYGAVVRRAPRTRALTGCPAGARRRSPRVESRSGAGARLAAPGAPTPRRARRSEAIGPRAR